MTYGADPGLGESFWCWPRTNFRWERNLETIRFLARPTKRAGGAVFDAAPYALCGLGPPRTSGPSRPKKKGTEPQTARFPRGPVWDQLTLIVLDRVGRGSLPAAPSDELR